MATETKKIVCTIWASKWDRHDTELPAGTECQVIGTYHPPGWQQALEAQEVYFPDQDVTAFVNPRVLEDLCES